MGSAVRSKVIMGAQALAIFLLATVLASLIPHYWIPSEYRLYLWLLAGLNILVALVLFWRMPESPRWLEARQRRDQARKIVERMEARVMKRHPVLPEPDLTPHPVVDQSPLQAAANTPPGLLNSVPPELATRPLYAARRAGFVRCEALTSAGWR